MIKLRLLYFGFVAAGRTPVCAIKLTMSRRWGTHYEEKVGLCVCLSTAALLLLCAGANLDYHFRAALISSGIG